MRARGSPLLRPACRTTRSCRKTTNVSFAETLPASHCQREDTASLPNVCVTSASTALSQSGYKIGINACHATAFERVRR